MIAAAGKYSALPKVARPSAASAAREDGRLGQAVAKADAARQAASPHIFIPQWRQLMGYREWVWKEFREGGYLAKTLEREKRTSAHRMRQAARIRDGFRQNNKAEHRLVATIPAREYFRARAVDKDFWACNRNLKNYKRDNPDAPIFV